MKKLKLFLLLSIIAWGPAMSQKVGLKLAQTTAHAFLQFKNKSVSEPTLNYCKIENADTLIYVFNNANKGFVMISGDMSISPVLAFSDEEGFQSENMSPATQMWIDWYSSYVSKARFEKSKNENPEWRMILNGTSLKNGSKNVAPLTTARWNQNTNYNYHCPEHPNGPGGHCYAGCVSTAMSMIMYYYKYPETGMGSFSYNHPYYGALSANFGATTYDWANMTNIINTQSKEAISLLMYHCGISVSMNYEPGSSGAQSEDAVYAFENYFHYRLTAISKNKDSYKKAEWWALLKNELDELRPILYSGSGSDGGHAFVCDGYQDTLFHFNWGWGGANNGYFRVDSLNSGNGNFSLSQSAIIGITPYSAPYCLEDRTITDETKTISDGSGPSLCWNNTDCSWLLQPGHGNVILTFTEFNTEADKDIVKIYNGTSASAPLLGSYSGATLPPMMVANSGSMFITFTTDAQNQSHGWKAEYISGYVGIDDMNAQQSIFYPNPVNDVLNIKIKDNDFKTESLKIYNLAGQVVWEKTYKDMEDDTFSVSISDLPAGLYNIVIVSDAAQMISGRIIKQ